MPTVLGFNGSTTVTFRISGMFCSASQDVFDVRTSDRSDQEFLLQVAFTS